MAFADLRTDALLVLRGNLLDGLTLVAEHVDAGTFDVIPEGRSTPPSEAGWVTLILLRQVDAALASRPAVLTDHGQ